MKPIAFAPDPDRALAAVQACPRHAATPLTKVQHDGASFWLKDEGARFGLGSFKALGGVYAIMRALCDRHESALGRRPSIDELFEPPLLGTHGEATFVCATAGNHGVAVAAGAALLGAKARVHLSGEVPEAFAARLRERGAEVVRSGAVYEESLQAAEADAAHGGGRLIADTAWEGYSEVPSGIMEGYTIIGEELCQAFSANGEWPQTVYLQAGVGGLAGALTWHIRHRWAVQPRIVIVEPEAATCLSASAETGQVERVSGPTSTMGRLDCKVASPLAVDAMRTASVEYMAISDREAEDATRWLAAAGHPSTPSGAAGAAAWERDRAGGVADPHPLIILSEGAL